MSEKIARWLVCRYPMAWRARYGEELLAIFEERRLRFTDVIDLLIGALDAHLEPHGVDTLQGKVLSTMNRLRSAEIQLFCAYVAFVVAGIGFQKVTEYEDFVAAANSHQAIGIAYGVIVFGAVAGLLAVLAGGVPVAWAVLRFALASRRRDIILRFAVPPVALAAWVGYTFLLINVEPTGNVDTPTKLGIGGSWIGLFVLAAIVSTVAVSTAISRADVDPQIFRFALVPGGFTFGAMALVVVAMAIWGIAMQVADPALLTGNGGVLSTNTLVSLGGQLAVMVVATIVAANALWRGRASIRLSDPSLT